MSSRLQPLVSIRLGQRFGVALVATLLAAADYVGQCLAESVPAQSMEESAGLLPNGSQLFSQVSIPETQICPKFVAAIVLGSSSLGDLESVLVNLFVTN